MEQTLTENCQPKKNVYLVTTKYHECGIISNSVFVSSGKFRELFLIKGGLVEALWKTINSKDNDGNYCINGDYAQEFRSIIEKRRIIADENGNLKEDYAKKFYTDDYKAESTIDTIAKTAVETIVPHLANDEKFLKLLTGFFRIELNDTVILITHNWYSSGQLSSLQFGDDTRYAFIEKLIEIAAKTEGIELDDMKLFLHDKDLSTSDIPDQPVRDYENYKKHILLSKVIKENRLYVFRHINYLGGFYTKVLNKDDIPRKEILDSYFLDRIPPAIKKKNEHIEIDISTSGKDEKNHQCYIGEIINAIADYQQKKRFRLNAVKKDDNYLKALEEFKKKDLSPILVKGDKSMRELQKEDGRAFFLDNNIWIRYNIDPKIFYDDSGKGYIIHCTVDGYMYILDGLTGTVLDTVFLGGLLEASPVVYNNMVVIGTRVMSIWGFKLR